MTALILSPEYIQYKLKLNQSLSHSKNNLEVTTELYCNLKQVGFVQANNLKQTLNRRVFTVHRFSIIILNFLGSRNTSNYKIVGYLPFSLFKSIFSFVHWKRSWQLACHRTIFKVSEFTRAEKHNRSGLQALRQNRIRFFLLANIHQRNEEWKDHYGSRAITGR